MSAIASLWTDHDRPGIGASAANVLIDMLDLELAVVQQADGPTAAARRQAILTPAETEALAQSLGPWLHAARDTVEVAHPLGEGTVRLVAVPLGRLDGELLAASRRSDFPREAELLILRVAANQAALVLDRRDTEEALREARDALEARVTERTRELSETNERLIRLDSLKSEFLANVTHELRTPLNAIIGFSELLQAPPAELSEKERAEFVDHVVAGSQALLDLINNIIDLGRIEAGRLVLSESDVHLAEAVALAVRAMAVQASARRVTVTQDVSPDLPLVWADPTRLGQILRHLLSNAIESSPEGGEVRLVAHSEDGLVRLLVNDQGPPLSEEDQERIFDAFEQARLRGTGVAGAGLGLAIARRVAEAHGGTVRVGRASTGRCFEIILPQPGHMLPRALQSVRRHGHEAALQQSEQRFRLLVESVKDYAIFMLDPQGRVQTWNPGARRIQGWTADEILGRSIELFYPPEDRAAGKPQRLLETARRQGRVEDKGWRVCKDGRRFLADVVISAMVDAHGHLSGFAKVTRDLSEQVRSEEALEVSEERFRLLVDSIADYAIFMLDAQGRILTWNTGAQRIKGYSPSEVIGQHYSICFTPEDRTRNLPARLMEQAQLLGRVPVAGMRMRKDGSRFYVDGVLTALRNREGGVIAYTKITRDVTEQRQTQVALTLAKQRAEAANLVKGEFLANMSHEVRTPMNAVLGLAEILLESPLTPEQRRTLTLLSDSAESLLDILNQILDLSKIEAGRLDLDEVRIAPDLALADALHMLGTRAEEKGLELICRFSPDLPATMVTDPVRLRQLVVNLVLNAIKFTERGEVVLALDWDPDGLHLSVSDTGPGIEPGMQQAIFEPFVQVDTANNRRFGGTGLGLTIVSRLVGMMGGRIWLESAPGQGSTFHVIVPVADPEGRRSTVPADWQGLHVLVADDNATVRNILQSCLRRWGMEPTGAASTEQALDFLSRERPPLVLLDVAMPGLAEAWKAAGGPDPVMMTVAGYHDLRLSGFPYVAIKPVIPGELREVLVRALRHEEPEAAVSVAGARRSLRVLLVEDNRLNQLVAETFLRIRGHQVTVVGSGPQAVSQVREHAFDVVLLDIQMPGQDGFETLDQLRRLPSGRSVPVVAMTAHAMKGYRERCLSKGFDDYLPKPFRKYELYAVVESQGTLEAGLVLDPSVLYIRTGGVPEERDQLVRAFLKLARGEMARLGELVPAGRWSESAAAALRVAQAAAEVGGNRVAAAASALGEALTGDVAAAPTFWERLQIEMGHLDAAFAVVA
ncbi:MAG TPA: ATP-binding protein [Candidatus Xenobia bacterium]